MHGCPPVLSLRWQLLYAFIVFIILQKRTNGMYKMCGDGVAVIMFGKRLFIYFASKEAIYTRQ